MKHAARKGKEANRTERRAEEMMQTTFSLSASYRSTVWLCVCVNQMPLGGYTMRMGDAALKRCAAHVPYVYTPIRLTNDWNLLTPPLGLSRVPHATV